ncbi:TonB-dependent receptor [Sphingomonas sp. BGYR3]|uniref:TonB-dependent receptor n=1 Tax=Sphingomonas sp. BGYR3 TaxID=2975483 RepID=UPI0021A6F4A6|nr:TonB-dependent receptor [Sphingomonas sp. BGYR3]MDG5488600.1 TonB-dependent receptor [Sphingomonas sp. BGYR3]
MHRIRLFGAFKGKTMRNHLFMGAAVAALMMPAAVSAQQITTGIEGTVTDESGAPLTGATVTITDTRTGVERTQVTGSTGSFRTDSLVTGGPYTVRAAADGYEGQTIEGVNLTLQGNTSLNFNLTSGAGDIVVTGARVTVTQLAIGPGQSFGTEDLETFPSITRDIRDIIRIDPRVSLDRQNEVDRISCLGGNDRSNTFSIDGIQQADIYGLNGTPFAARNAQPIPFDAVRETSVEFAPFDVQYGQFTGCAINVVTKSGQNTFHGSAFFNYASDSLQGNSLNGRELNIAPFEEKRWGAALSGPIIKDKLFFSFAYEETDLGDVEDTGLIGSNYPNEVNFANLAQFERFSQIAREVYGVDPGPAGQSLPEYSVRYFGRLDWYITEGHRFEATYQRLKESNIEPDDFGADRFTGLNSYEDEGTDASFYSARLYSDWSDMFSTEVRVSRADVADVQGPLGGGEAQSANPLPRLVVGVSQPGPNNTRLDGSFVAGPGFSRAANDLQTQVDQLKVAAHIKPEGHDITIGFEANQADVFNLFVQNATGTLTFANLDDFAAGLLTIGGNSNPNGTQIVNGATATGNNGASGAYTNATPTLDVNTAAAAYKRTQFSIYAQDSWQVTPRLNVLAGVRADWFDGGSPQTNPEFIRRYGFANNVSFSNIPVVVQPRVGFTYNFENDGFLTNSQLKGGVGIFSGGDPLVWVSNAFQNNGRAIGFGDLANALCNPIRVGGRVDVVNAQGQFTGVPGCVFQAAADQANRGLADTQSTDPNFRIPTVLRANLGFATRIGTASGLFSDWNLNLDYIYSKFRNPASFVDLAQVVRTTSGLNGFTVDGRPIYASIDPTVAGCTAVLQNQGGTPPTYTNINAPCFNTQRDDEIQLTNSAGFESHAASVILSKRFDSGLFTAGGTTRFNLGYAFTDAEQRRFNNATTAGSSFDGATLFDRQDPERQRSSYASKHNITLGLNFREQFFDEYDTSFGFVFVGRSGRPYSYVFANGGVFADSVSGTFNNPIYVPTGVSDPNVAPTSNAAAVAAYDQFISGNDCVSKYRGRTMPANVCENDWFFDLDLRFSQELPGPANFFGVKDRFTLFADFDNFLNLIDSNWNISRTVGNNVGVIDSGVDAQGRYVLTNFSNRENNLVSTSPSLWRIQLGVRYGF